MASNWTNDESSLLFQVMIDYKAQKAPELIFPYSMKLNVKPTNSLIPERYHKIGPKPNQIGGTDSRSRVNRRPIRTDFQTGNRAANNLSFLKGRMSDQVSILVGQIEMWWHVFLN